MNDITGTPCSNQPLLNRLVQQLLAGAYDMSPVCMKQAPIYSIVNTLRPVNNMLNNTHLTNDGKTDVTGAQSIQILNPTRADQLRRLRPPWNG